MSSVGSPACKEERLNHNGVKEEEEEAGDDVPANWRRTLDRDTVVLIWAWPFGHQFKPESCSQLFNVAGCRLTHDRSEYENVHAVMFHHRDVQDNLDELLRMRRPPLQKWVWMNMESPGNSQRRAQLDGLFNLTASYRRDSDVWVPYGRIVEASEEDQAFQIPPKDKLVCWIVNNWDTRLKRVRYFYELDKHVPIHTYGGAFERQLSLEEYYRTLSSCKFYLSFENSIHKDYFTEKLFNPLRYGTVPVVLGPSRKNYEEFIPGDSFIHVDDFKSPQELAEHLTFLDQNQEAYERYFTWRQYFTAEERAPQRPQEARARTTTTRTGHGGAPGEEEEGEEEEEEEEEGGQRPQLEGVLSKYTNLIQGWQNRYFVLDEDLNQLQYFVNEPGRSQKPRGTLPLIGASVSVSDEAPHMFVVSSANGELFKLRAVDGREQQLWMSHIQSCATDSSVSSLKDTNEQLGVDKTVSSLDIQGSSRRSFSLLPSASSSTSSSPRLQRHLPHLPHPHRSPAASRRAKHTQAQPDTLLGVREVIHQVECQQKSLVHSIELLPRRGGVSCLDQDLLLLKATSAATLRCLAQCLSMLQQHRHAHSLSDPAQPQVPPSEECDVDDVKTAGCQGPMLSEDQTNTC
ncbi:hypothetical protein AMELA_G00164840 [Ameiurus melas]|uniref:Fucosyltransferase n=1 Tax=Ameiurus melas TaxID=219545 RepID=A0A7J6AJS7_AMEME|nr:hypothetical protein AMELA_G00164840 [Ameiurus melas]